MELGINPKNTMEINNIEVVKLLFFKRLNSIIGLLILLSYIINIIIESTDEIISDMIKKLSHP